MTFPKLIDEIDQLFARLVRDPWSRPAVPPAVARAEDETYLDVDIPGVGGPLGDVSVSLAGQQLVVRARDIERSFLLPVAADVAAIEARVEGDTLRVRVCLRRR